MLVQDIGTLCVETLEHRGAGPGWGMSGVCLVVNVVVVEGRTRAEVAAQ